MSDIPLYGTLAPNPGSTAPISRAVYMQKGFAVVADSTERDGILSGAKLGGFIVFRDDTGNFERWNGASWVIINVGGGAGGDGFAFTFSTTTTDADPGTGALRFNNATLASVTSIFVDLIDADANDVTGWLDSLDDTAVATKGRVRVGSKSNKTKWVEFELTSVTVATGYRKLGVTYVTAGAGGLPTTNTGDTFLSYDATALRPNLAGQALTNAGTISYNEVDVTGTNVDWSAGQLAKKLGITTNVTLTFTDPPGLCDLELRISQDATGGRTVTLPGSITWLDGVVWQVNPTGGSTSVLVLKYIGSGAYLAYGRAADSRVISESTTARSFTVSDIGAFIENTAGSAVSYTVDPNSTTPLPIGAEITGIQGGAGQLTFVQGAGVTINKAASRNRRTFEQGSPWALKKTAVNTWWLFGDLELT